MEMNLSTNELEDSTKNFHTDFKKAHEDLKKWQKSNEKSSRRVFWVSIAMIVLAAVQIVVGDFFLNFGLIFRKNLLHLMRICAINVHKLKSHFRRKIGLSVFPKSDSGNFRKEVPFFAQISKKAVIICLQLRRICAINVDKNKMTFAEFADRETGFSIFLQTNLFFSLFRV